MFKESIPLNIQDLRVVLFTLIASIRIPKNAPKTYKKSGFAPNDSKNILHFLLLRSITDINRENKVAPIPHVASTKLGDHIFLLIGHT
ncbi:hypothetical protein JCM30204_00450 [Dysgonomonas termitidis]|uniref:Uncharacterized protein n=1 Tax=Dysgonomonas termitidis TaxID=1516126 RepID=A0ABV9L2R4_9BACT